jgi:DNA repair photolyase
MADNLTVKSNALPILEKQLKSRSAKSQYGFVAVGSATDAYMPQESSLHMTEGMLSLLLKYRFPVFISTKRQLITRDIEILKQIDHTAILPNDLANRLKRGLILSVSISTMDEKVSNLLEHGACKPLERLALLKELKSHGFMVGVNAIPILPFISDTDEQLEKIIEAAANHDADYVLTGGLTLFGGGEADSKTLYYKFLQLYDPSLIPRYDMLYKENSYAPNSYHSALKIRSDYLCRKYNIRNRILE